MQLANLDGQYAAAAIHEDAHGKRQADAKRVGRCEPVFFADQQRIVNLGLFDVLQDIFTEVDRNPDDLKFLLRAFLAQLVE